MMASFDKIDYSNRPSKHIERKILIHLLSLLTNHDYDIKSYKYVGFGSIHYLDHILFHKYLNITKLVCLEKEDIPKRMKFNKPFDFIDLQMVPYSNYLASLSNQELYLIWADYDSMLTMDNLQDIGNTIGTMPNDSIFITTFNADKVSYTSDIDVNLDENEHGVITLEEKKLAALIKALKEEFSPYLSLTEKTHYSYNKFPTVISSIIDEKVKEHMVGRPNDDIVQFINYCYKDGATMISMGWIIGEKPKIAALRASDFVNDPYVIEGNKAFNITVPPLTVKEKKYIDSMLNEINGKLDKGAKPDLAFELNIKHLKNYLNVYKYYPEFKDSYV